MGTPPRTGCIVVAAGAGSRLGADRPKAYVDLAGRPILDHALRGVLDVPGITRIVVVAPASHVDSTVDRWAHEPRIAVVAGGAQRTDSVAAGLAALGECDVVLVHDAARCLTPRSVFERVTAAVVAGAAAAIPGLPVVDTIKVVDSDGHVVATPDRASLRAVQTPQGFTPEALRRAHAGGSVATDDAALVEALGLPVVVVDGDPRALKITTPDDLTRAEALLEDPV
ncbi:2-C-methyl-D-erythritol 4-phosphate cytidylyltransferase [Kribbia dieselivorans]|uniref:2-C-methyl-D-erythritol 4-phosphate cytidylyltransferase n=1 Tax=Kribbia dieselivorans TaxID=331526 RepID=UPI0009FA1646|nr:2-C-methyl-D-erythritol 4-phosphate cytidylyltransferase [Kribbia dieselivorans]